MNTMLIGIGVVGGFVIWKFIIQPIMNKDEPIEPPKDYKSLPEQLEEAVQTNTSTDVNF